MQGLIPAAWAAVASAAAPAVRLLLRRRAARGKELLHRLPEREGIDRTPRPPGRLLWVHGASVGEAVSVLPVLCCLADAAPGLTVLLTTGTVSSAVLLAQRLPELGLDRVLHRFVPMDVPAWAARFLDHWRPDAAAFLESELWPNLLSACQARGVPLMLLNGRMSARSFRGWRRVPGFAGQVLGAFDRIHPQSPEYGERLRALGGKCVGDPGNLKLAAAPLPADPSALAQLRQEIGGRPVWLAASTHAGEEAVAARVHRALAACHPGLLTIIAPRHPDRGQALAGELGGVPRRASGEGPPPGGIWLADTMGELGLFYRLAPLVFVGRSLVGEGGQNPLEPARLGCAIAVGPHTANFAPAVARLREAGGLTEVPDEAALQGWVDAMLRDEALRRAAGYAALGVANGEAALPARLAGVLVALMERAG